MATKSTEIERAAKVIKESQAIVVTAGAGMGVDSGLPDFRGPEGFWRAYPPIKDRGLTFPETSNPEWFIRDPKFAWGFFGHRYHLYKNAEPHLGFQILRKWTNMIGGEHFVFTSNVDGHFQKAGFSEDRVIECHGSVHFLQCVHSSKCSEIWPVPYDFNIDIDYTTFNAVSVLPKGPPGKNTELARPNVLMFGDWDFVGTRTEAQQDRFDEFVNRTRYKNLVVIEIGAGLAVPTVRWQSECLVQRRYNATLIRINPGEPEVPSDKEISLQIGGLDALKQIDEEIEKLK